MLKKYKTFLEKGESETIQKKSKFFGTAQYATNEYEIKEILESIRKANYGANHNCYAYRIEGQSVIERQSDDGEPQGTAGLPILDVLRGEDIINGIIVVTRFFGGTLLGTGGLVRAYGQAAKGAALNAGIILKEQYSSISVITDYSLSGKIEYELNKNDTAIDEILYTDKVEFKVYIPIDNTERFIKQMTDLTAAESEIIEGPKVYGGIINGKFRLV